MGLPGWIIVVGLLAGLYFWYATIVTRRNRVSEALAGIDVQLNQRHDLIPNLLAIAKRFMAHEKTLLEEITALRARASEQTSQRDPAAVGERFATEGRLEAGLVGCSRWRRIIRRSSPMLP